MWATAAVGAKLTRSAAKNDWPERTGYGQGEGVWKRADVSSVYRFDKRCDISMEFKRGWA